MSKPYVHPVYGAIPPKEAMPINSAVSDKARDIALSLIAQHEGRVMGETGTRLIDDGPVLYRYVRQTMGRTPEIYPDNAYDDESISDGIVKAINESRGIAVVGSRVAINSSSERTGIVIERDERSRELLVEWEYGKPTRVGVGSVVLLPRLSAPTPDEVEDTSEDDCTEHGFDTCPDCGNGGVKMGAKGYEPCARFRSCWSDDRFPSEA